jgi:hypothetical protein
MSRSGENLMYDDEEPPVDCYPAFHQAPYEVATLIVYKAEWPDFDAVRKAYGYTEIIDFERIPITSGFIISLRCSNARAARLLSEEWYDYSEASLHRPHSKEEAENWGNLLPEFAHIPRDWVF